MKRKMLCVMMSMVLMGMAVGCGTGGDRNPDEVTTEAADKEEMVHLESAEDVAAFFEEVYQAVGENNLPSSLTTTELDLSDADMISYQAGLSDTSQIAGITMSEPMMSSIAYSAVYVRTADGADTDSIAQEMMENINPAKWLCVEAQKQLVATIGSDVFYIMAESVNVDNVMGEVKNYAEKNNMSLTIINEKTNY